MNGDIRIVTGFSDGLLVRHGQLGADILGEVPGRDGHDRLNILGKLFPIFQVHGNFDQRQRVEARVHRMLGNLVQTGFVVGGEHRVVSSINNTLTQCGVDLGTRQVHWRRPRGGKHRLHQTFRCTHLEAFQVLHTVQRFLRNKRLQASATTANKLHAIGRVELVHQLIATAIIDVIDELVRAGPGAHGIANEPERGIFAGKITGHRYMAIQDAHIHGTESFGMAYHTAHGQQINGNTATCHLFDAISPLLLNLEVLDARGIGGLELERVVRREGVKGKCS